MPRKRALDKYVTSFVDRHGTERFRFRRGKVSIYLPALGSADYATAYDRALNQAGIIPRARVGSMNDLIGRFYASLPFRRAGDAWQRTMRQSIEPFREEYGNDLAKNFRPKDIDKILVDRFTPRLVKGKRVGGSSSAERLREMLVRLFRLAVRLEWVASNPAELSEPIRHKGPGYYAWNEKDIAAYRKRWPLGTKARLALELMLWTGARRGNAHRMAPPESGRMKAIAVKTGKEIDMLVAPALQEAIDAMPEGSTGTTLIVTEYGKPFSAAGFGNKMREWCDAANLPQCTAHGLRKALLRRGAELKVQQQGLKALGQWSQDREVALYVETANRRNLADDALTEIVEWERSINNG